MIAYTKREWSRLFSLAYTWRLHPKWVPLSGFRYLKGWGNLSFPPVKRPKRANRRMNLRVWKTSRQFTSLKDSTFTAVYKRDADLWKGYRLSIEGLRGTLKRGSSSVNRKGIEPRGGASLCKAFGSTLWGPNLTLNHKNKYDRRREPRLLHYRSKN